MDKKWILIHLKEAEEELIRTIKEIEQDQEFDFNDYFVAMQHLYNHLNTAWNSRDANSERVQACSEEDFYAWRQFPRDIDLSGI